MEYMDKIPNWLIRSNPFWSRRPAISASAKIPYIFLCHGAGGAYRAGDCGTEIKGIAFGPKLLQSWIEGAFGTTFTDDGSSLSF